MSDHPVVVLGVSRSGTTLLKEMLDSNSDLAIPTESYFIPPNPTSSRSSGIATAAVSMWTPSSTISLGSRGCANGE